MTIIGRRESKERGDTGGRKANPQDNIYCKGILKADERAAKGARTRDCRGRIGCRQVCFIKAHLIKASKWYHILGMEKCKRD